MNHTTGTTRLHRTYSWIGRHVGLVTVAALTLALALGFVGPLVANTDEPDFNPSGGVFDTYEYVDQTLRSSSSVHGAMWLVEAANRGENVLTRDVLLEWKQQSDAVRDDPANASHLIDRYDPDTGATVPGVMSIADVVDGVLPGGLAGATDAEVTSAVSMILADGSPMAEMRSTLSEQAESTPDGWTSPAFSTQVVYESAGFENTMAEEEWLRSVQAQFR
ncbi:MAG: hypothetical protein JRE18_12545, partial [Deltaproteobacteria bacterium]|nr:hypothetical protein [Deltaproteobacteria bacterium]